MVSATLVFLPSLTAMMEITPSLTAPTGNTILRSIMLIARSNSSDVGIIPGLTTQEIKERKKRSRYPSSLNRLSLSRWNSLLILLKKDITNCRTSIYLFVYPPGSLGLCFVQHFTTYMVVFGELEVNSLFMSVMGKAQKPVEFYARIAHVKNIQKKTIFVHNHKLL